MADAYTRKDKVPVKIVKQQYASTPVPTEVAGEYNNDFESPDITVKVPYQFKSAEQPAVNPSGGEGPYPNPLSVMDVIRHELVHHYLKNVDLPTLKEYDSPTWGGNDANSRFEAFGFNQWGRAGNPQAEIPAYMNAYNAPSMKEVINKSLQQKYVNQFNKFLELHKHLETINQLKDLASGQENQQNLW